MSRPAICYYVSGHGLGHASRAAQVMAALPGNLRIIVKSMAPEKFLHQASGRALKVIPERFDVGVLQPDNRTLDWKGTFELAAKLYAEGLRLLDDEVEFLKSQNVCVVVCDVSPLPLVAASLAGIPALLVANFTWLDIYRLPARQIPMAQALLEQYLQAYRKADLTLRPGLAFPMSYLAPQREVGLIARQGTSIRQMLHQKLGIPRNHRIVLLYFGNMGDDGLKLNTVRGGSSISFLSFTDLSPLAIQLNQDEWHFPDVVASVDAVMAKPGYGTVGECMANGTPVVFFPRPDFAEYRILRRDLIGWGGAVQMSTADFLNGNWKAPLEKAFNLRPHKVIANGAKVVAREIEQRLK